MVTEPQRRGPRTRLDVPSLSEEQFLAFYPQRKAASTMNERVLEWFLDHPEAWTPPGALEEEAQRLSILSVGAGDGEFDARWLRSLQERYGASAVQYVGLEPAPSIARRLKKRMENLDGVRVVPRAFEDWHPHELFGVVAFVHSLHFFDQTLETLEQASRLLRPQGRVVVVQQTAIGVHQVAQSFSLPSGFGGLDWAETQRILDEASLTFERHAVPAIVDVTEVVRWSRTGVQIASIWLGLDLDLLSQQQQRILREVVREMAHPTPNGRWVLPEPLEVIVITGGFGDEPKEG